MSLDPGPTRFIGCDVGKANIVVFDSATCRSQTVPNNAAALSAFALTLDPTCLVVCEATGGYEAPLLAAALLAGCPAHRADARKVKAFIRSFGLLGKTDAIDARALARYGTERQASLTRWKAPDESRDRLQALVLTRRDFVAQRQACTNRLAAPGAAPVTAHLRALLDCLSDQIDALDRDIAALIGTETALAKADAALRAIIGIGPKTAAALLALMPELGHLNRRQAAALAGLAPHPNQSGTADRYRRVRGGRPEVKRVLFMAALVAAKRNQTLRVFYQRLCQAGKKPLVALVAVMRKLVIIANATLRDIQNQSIAVS
jgi:transposase